MRVMPSSCCTSAGTLGWAWATCPAADNRITGQQTVKADILRDM
jgi:hypothetical protein